MNGNELYWRLAAMVIIPAVTYALGLWLGKRANRRGQERHDALLRSTVADTNRRSQPNPPRW